MIDLRLFNKVKEYRISTSSNLNLGNKFKYVFIQSIKNIAPNEYIVKVKFFKPIHLNLFKLPLVNFINSKGNMVKRVKTKSMKKVACMDGVNFIYSKV